MSKILFSLFVFLISVKAWDQQPHMIFAQIAYSQIPLSQLEKIQTQINYFRDFFPNYSDPLSAAVWADEIRSYNINFFTTWHYIDTPYFNDTKNNQVNSNIFRHDVNSNIFRHDVNSNVVWAMKEIYDTYSSGTDDWGYGFSIRYLLHLVGDIHQPMHNIELYSKLIPKGDHGGNKYKIIVENKSTNLHSFWDSCGGLYTKKFNFPLSSDEITIIKNNATTLMKIYANTTFVSTLNPKVWSLEGYRIAKNYAYNTSYDKPVSNRYISQTRKICSQRIFVAGMRLANLLLQTPRR